MEKNYKKASLFLVALSACLPVHTEGVDARIALSAAVAGVGFLFLCAVNANDRHNDQFTVIQAQPDQPETPKNKIPVLPAGFGQVPAPTVAIPRVSRIKGDHERDRIKSLPPTQHWFEYYFCGSNS